MKDDASNTDTTGVATAQSLAAEPRGIGGWLILSIILLVVMIVGASLQLSTFNALAEVASGLPQWKIYVLSAQVLFSVILGMLCPAILLFMLSRKTAAFPRMFVLWAIAYVIFMVINHFMILVIFGDLLGTPWDERFSVGALRSLFLSIVPVAVFIPYMLISRRVRNTFVN